MRLSYLPHSEIDKKRWDHCVESAPNGLVYGLSGYLDAICPNWDALVTPNYEFVMPLPWKRKYGFYIIYHPWFAQQLGGFGQNVSGVSLRDIYRALPKKFIHHHFSFNAEQKFPQLPSRTNFVLPLQTNYEALKKGYNENTLRNLKKVSKHGYSIDTIFLDEFLAFKLNHMETRLSTEHLNIYKNLMNWLLNQSIGNLAGVKDEKGNLLAAVCWVNFKNRILYLSAVSSPEGKEQRVMTLLIDSMIEQKSGTNYCIDFEGSTIDGVARFYKGFGAQPEEYFQHKGTLLQRLIV